jgi:hypothetical protein
MPSIGYGQAPNCIVRLVGTVKGHLVVAAISNLLLWAE